MSLYKQRGSKNWWFGFWWNGEHVQKSTKTANKQAARAIEAAHRVALANGEAGIFERKKAPTLKGFAQPFIDAIQVQCGEHPETVKFYAAKLTRLLEYKPLADARLDAIDEAMLDTYIQHRRRTVGPASVNREMATLRRLMRLAYRHKLITYVPKFEIHEADENEREFVLTHAQEEAYLAAAPQPLADFAVLALDLGLRIGEALSLEWRDVHFEPVGKAKLGYVHVRGKPGPDGVYRGKSKKAKRNLTLSERVRTMLKGREAGAKAPWVFTDEEGARPLSIWTLENQHARVRKALGLRECVIHSFRHTFGTRFGEAGADAFTIMRAMGHSSVKVSQKYVHPTAGMTERAFERLEALNRKAIAGLERKRLGAGKATIVPTIVADEDDDAA